MHHNNNQQRFFWSSVGLMLSSDMCRPRQRGMCNIIFQMSTTVGILIAGLVNYGKHCLKCVPSCQYMMPLCTCVRA